MKLNELKVSNSWNMWKTAYDWWKTLDSGKKKINSGSGLLLWLVDDRRFGVWGFLKFQCKGCVETMS